MRITSLALILSASLAGCVSPDDPNTSTTESDISVYQWTDDQPTGGRSGFQPGLASFGGRLHMLMTNMDLVYYTCGSSTCSYPSHKLKWQRFNGSSWSTPVDTGQLADSGPALAVLNNRLVAVYHAYNQNRLVMTTGDGTNGWSTPVNAGTTLNSTTLRNAPAVAVRNNLLYAAYCIGDSAGDHVRIDQYDSTAWRTVGKIDVDGTCKGVAMTLEPDGHLRLLFNNQLGTSIWSFSESRDNGSGTVWTTTRLNNKYTVKPPSIAYCNGTTHMIHGGYSNGSEIWWSAIENGAWISDQKVPNQTSDNGAAVACYNGTRPIMVHNGGYDDMHWSEFVP